MPHLEDKPVQDLIIDQIQEIFRQSFIMGERAVLEAAKRNGLSESETKELLIANGLPIGMEFMKQITNTAQIVERANPKDVDKMIESMDLVLDYVRKKNKLD
jgi:hypothetical protein